ncbi:hypothetical protein COS54_01870 [Candidatus Shapirobacteria bacterium CG03_land_8_20_14_0_80_39_12]|uniref:Methyltransferase type 11 domain-containing protein n=1 Tax=Candidatus Shapirobacteria bacterium CG03_land_8_20_14_0_80_39_12 TaxID=1974879 RepID=A0A2M7BD01_9BACT|nr:MAG: hypothetical protein COS54_01870 [Candidatus Shapirobacteria bacterium CG03_land_8_20_14_0_80_39_12]
MKDYLIKVDNILPREPDPAFARRARIIFANLDINGNEKILEIGCGRGFYLKTLKEVWPKLEVTGIDLNLEYLKKAEEFVGELKVNLRVADATKLPFEDKTFDRIIATEILEHIPDDQKAIAEIYRVLKPGGMVMITVPNINYPFLWDPLNWTLERFFRTHIPSNVWWLAGIWADHVRLYDERELKNKIEKKRFKIEKIWHSTRYCFPFCHFILYGIGKNLVEKGLFKNYNRFIFQNNPSLMKKILLFPIRWIDSKNININDQNCSSVNLIFKAKK